MKAPGRPRGRLPAVLAMLVLAAIVVPAALLWLASEKDRGALPLEGAARSVEPSAAESPGISPGPKSLDAAEPLLSEREAAETLEPAPMPPERRETRVRGRVVDAAGDPVAGARVLLASADRGPGLPLDAEVWDERSRRRRECETAADGTFAFEEVRPGPTRIAVRADGFAPHDGTHLFVAPDADQDAGAIELVRGVIVSGRVLDSIGRGVAGAAVLAPFDRADASYRGRPGLTGITVATTDESGRFETSALALGWWTLLVRSEEHPDATVSGTALAPGERQEVLVELAAEASIAGRVDASESALAPPASELTVQAAYTGSRERQPGEADFSRRSGACAPDGTFRIAGLLEGEPYRLRVRRHRNADDWKGSEIGEALDCVAGDRGVVLRLTGFRALSFRATDSSSGAELDEVEATLWAVSEGRERRLGSLVTRLGGGRVRVSSDARLSTEERLFALVRDGTHRAFRTESVSVSSGGELDLGGVALDPLGHARILVRDAASGEPVSGARLHVELLSGEDGSRPVSAEPRGQPDRGDRLRSPESDAGGAIDVYATLGATGRACVTHEDYPSTPLFDLLFGAPGAAPREVLLDPGASAIVLVLDPAGAPAPGQVVNARSELPPGADRMEELRLGTRQQRTDASGRALFASLTPGPTRFQLVEDRIGARLKASDPLPAVARVDLVAGDEIEVVLLATPRGTLSGRVVDGHRPLVGATIELRAGTEQELARRKGEARPDVVAFTDAAGRFSFPRLGAGAWTLNLSHPSRVAPYVRTLVLAGADEDLEIVLPRCSVLGSVRAKGGDAVVGAEVTLGRMVRDPRRGANDKVFAAYRGAAANVRTGPDGSFELLGLPAGVELALSIEHERYQSARTDPFVLAHDEVRGGFDVELRPGATIAVQVWTSDGRAPQSKVTARRVADDRGKPARGPSQGAGTDGLGRARFTGLPGGLWRVTLERTFEGLEGRPTREIEVEVGRESTVRFDVP